MGRDENDAAIKDFHPHLKDGVRTDFRFVIFGSGRTALRERRYQGTKVLLFGSRCGTKSIQDSSTRKWDSASRSLTREIWGRYGQLAPLEYEPHFYEDAQWKRLDGIPVYEDSGSTESEEAR